MIEAGAPVGLITSPIEPKAVQTVNQNLAGNWQTNLRDGGRGLAELFVKGVPAEVRRTFLSASDGGADVPVCLPGGAENLVCRESASGGIPAPRSDSQRHTAGTQALPLLGHRQSGRQRAFLKIQDGCDAHCTYCIIPSLRPTLWSKPVADAVEEAAALVAAGHVEIVLTGIFLGAYGQPTALRRRQPQGTDKPLAGLIDALCTRVPGLRRVRLSSLEPGDLTDELLSVLRSHAQVVPHFHLPLQSGSEALLRKMNRQYTRDDFLRMVDRVRNAFDRPALTTDVVCGFPGETDEEFVRTMEVVEASGFIHVHAFPYSPRPGTAAARWTKQFVRGPAVNERIERLRTAALEHSFAFRSSFLGETVEVIVERDSTDAEEGRSGSGGPTERAMRHGRCERYFPVTFNDPQATPGESVRLKITAVTPKQTIGHLAADH
ncbi:MAG TPA: MiaB/RimO family radical SAM methylthiotransferase [Tepidisphaeraceae bacterium]|nr:MiaB/RimO family radical SAM methylthiotransferase [Tepidisphaeraceae bacterium]